MADRMDRTGRERCFKLTGDAQRTTATQKSGSWDEAMERIIQ